MRQGFYDVTPKSLLIYSWRVERDDYGGFTERMNNFPRIHGRIKLLTVYSFGLLALFREYNIFLE